MSLYLIGACFLAAIGFVVWIYSRATSAGQTKQVAADASAADNVAASELNAANNTATSQAATTEALKDGSF